MVAEGLELGDGSLAGAVGVAPDEEVAAKIAVVAVLADGAHAPMRAELGRVSPFSSVVAATGHGISEELGRA